MRVLKAKDIMSTPVIAVRWNATFVGRIDGVSSVETSHVVVAESLGATR